MDFIVATVAALVLSGVGAAVAWMLSSESSDPSRDDERVGEKGGTT